MPDGPPRGPQVDRVEGLYRAIHLREWWNGEVVPPRPRSAAFNWPSFSVNIASRIGEPGAVRHLEEVLRCPQGALVEFNCGVARDLGFDARKESDPKYPENDAHANVYFDGPNGIRKKHAKKLAREHCRVVRSPQF